MQPQTDFDQARINMVNGQIRPNNITDERLIEALRTIPRESFVPAHLNPFAYSEDDLDIGEGRFALAPLTLASLVQVAKITEDDSVLIIACGTGYLSALVGKMAGSVIGVDDNPNFTEEAEINVKEADILNVTFHTAPLTAGYPKHGPYSVIIIEGAVQDIPQQLSDQLEPHGRIITIFDTEGSCSLTTYHKIDGTITPVSHFSLSAPLLSDFIKKEEFSL